MIGGVYEISRFVVEAVWEVLPVFVISVFLGVLVRALRFDGAVRRAFGARIGVSILLATTIGVFSPFCSCTVVPLVAGLLMAGVPLAPVMSFWLASPTMDPEIFALSVGLLGWPLAVARLLATLLLSLGAGYLTLLLTRTGFLRGKVLRSKAAEQREAEDCYTELPAVPTHQPILVGTGAEQMIRMNSRPADTAPAAGTCGAGCDTEPVQRPARKRWWTTLQGSFRGPSWREVGGDAAKEGWRLGRWLVLAFVLEALILAYVPQEAIAGTLGDGPFAVPLAALVGLPLYMNEVGALPIVSGLLEAGMSPGAAIAFLIAGAATTVPAMAAVWSLVKPRVFALYTGIALIGAMTLGISTDAVL